MGAATESIRQIQPWQHTVPNGKREEGCGGRGERLGPSWRRVFLSFAGLAGRVGDAGDGRSRIHACLVSRLLVCAVLRTRQDRGWGSCPTRRTHASDPWRSTPLQPPPAQPPTIHVRRNGREKKEQKQKQMQEPRRLLLLLLLLLFFLFSVVDAELSQGRAVGLGGGVERQGWRETRHARMQLLPSPTQPHRPAQPHQRTSTRPHHEGLSRSHHACRGGAPPALK